LAFTIKVLLIKKQNRIQGILVSGKIALMSTVQIQPDFMLQITAFS